MKQTITLVLLTLLGGVACWMPSAQADGLPEITDFTVEAKESISKQVPILVLFKSEYCPYCVQVLDEFLMPMQRRPQYGSKVLFRQIDIGSSQKLINFNGKPISQSAFAKANEVWAVPTVVLFDSEGHVLTKIIGLLTVDFYLAYLDNAIDESQAKIKAAAKLR
jgi:thioredoxin-related protein